MPKFHYCEQYSDEYWDLHLGVPTASNFPRIITGEGEPSKQHRSYMFELICERLLRENVRKPEIENNYWIQRGSRLEKEAFERIEREGKRKLKKVGFVTEKDDTPYVIGCSPDALVEGANEAIEIKCPAPWTHMGYILDGPGRDYKQQVQGQLLVGGFERVHFVSYHPQMPLYHLVTERDEKYIRNMQRVLEMFCEVLYQETIRAKSKGEYIVRPTSV